MSEKEKKVADFLVNSDSQIVSFTIAEFAKKTNVSESTIFKFVKKLGFRGFQDFKLNIAKNFNSEIVDPSPIVSTEIDKNDTSYEIATKVIQANVASIKSLREIISQKTIDSILSIISKSKKIHFFGLGGSSVIAFDSYQKFLRTKYDCNYIFDYHLQLVYSTKLTDKDVVFIFSNSGQSVETLNLARKIAKSKAKLIVLTGNPASELLNLSDNHILVFSDSSTFRPASISSRIMYVTIMDIIYINIMSLDSSASYSSMSNIRSALSVSKTDSDYIS